jgi:phosphoribosylformimino-5-aminoimidazole carboxamide ribonucleotide (ProFAR) isomerase
VAGIERDDAASPGQLLDLLDVIMAVNLPVQLRVPWRRAERIGDLLSRGASRVAVEVDANPEWVADLLERFGERVIPAVILAADRDPDLERRRLAGLGAMGARRVLCVDEARRGTLAGPDLPLVRTLAGAGAPLIWEGGMGSAEDVRRLAACPGVEAVVLGRALRESRFTAAEARQWAGDEIQ